VLRFLEERGRGEHVEGVERRSAFEAEFKFDSETHAAALVEDLAAEATDASQPMREALVQLDADGTTVKLRFEPVGEPRLHELGTDHETACILHGAVMDE
jgi:hypothetical protein